MAGCAELESLELIERIPSISRITMTVGSLHLDVNMDELERLVERPLFAEIDLPRHDSPLNM